MLFLYRYYVQSLEKGCCLRSFRFAICSFPRMRGVRFPSVDSDQRRSPPSPCRIAPPPARMRAWAHTGRWCTVATVVAPPQTRCANCDAQLIHWICLYSCVLDMSAICLCYLPPLLWGPMNTWSRRQFITSPYIDLSDHP